MKCKKPFTIVMSISEYETGKVKCPKCGKGQVKQQVTTFQTKTSKKS
jgi:putative FmdB family regulatory protein